MIGAHHRKPIEWQVFDEGLERAFDLLEIAVKIEMFGIDIGDNGNGGGKAQKTAVGLIGFHHHPFSGAKPRIGAVDIDNPAIDDRRIKATALQKRSHHCCGGSFAMCSGNRDRTLQPHQFGKHFGTPHNRQTKRARGGEFRIVGFHRRRVDHDLRVRQVVGFVSNGHRNSEFA